jgi:hypothetical protein
MRRTRVVLGLLLAAVLVFSMAGGVLAAASFSDIEDNPYEASILNMASRGFAGGYADDTFRPDNPLQRQQFAKMAVLTLGYEVTAADVSTFPDTPAPYDPVNNPLYPGSYVAVAAANNIIAGYTDGNFGFTDYVTRQQVITIAVRAAGDALMDAPEDYVGVLDYSNEFHGANVKKAEYNGLLDGIQDLATWDLTASATRGEAAEILSQVFYKTGKILKITGPDGTVELTMADLKAMTAVEGYGGIKKKTGTIVGPFLYKGVAIQDLMALVGGGATVSAIATDGYESDYSADEVNGTVTAFDPTTGEELTTITGPMTMILAYEVDGAPFPSSEGVLRVAFVTPTEEQVTSSGMWASQVAELMVQAEEAPEETSEGQ